MSMDGQADVIEFLRQPSAYGAREPVEVIQTHISLVFLAGDRAFKLKRAVRLPYVDFSTPALRIAACRRELELNRKTAPHLYRKVRRITRQRDGSLALDGAGEVVDAVVEMQRFDQSCLFDRIAERGELTVSLMEDLSRGIAGFHAAASTVHSAGGAGNMSSVLDINEAGFATSDVFTKSELKLFNKRFRVALDGVAALLDAREREGRIRRCHGDLHLSNICLFENRPTIFDCIDFNERIATTDVLYDLAFLLMDLEHRGLPGFSNLVANRYMDAGDEVEGFALLPFFMAVRAAVRAHVAATAAASSPDRRDELEDEARSYFDLAVSLLELPRPRLLVIGGLSGSGKSTVAEGLAWKLGGGAGARILESDRIRKSLFGVGPETRLPVEAYRQQVSDRVYGELADQAARIASAGGTVVVNAVFDTAEYRSLIERAALRSGVRKTAVWLSADADTLLQRVVGRHGGPSDATKEIVAAQLKRVQPPSGWRRIDASRPVEETIATLLST